MAKEQDWRTLLAIAQESQMAQPQTPAAQQLTQSVQPKLPVPAVDRGAITQSFYTQPTNRKTYEKNRPVYQQSAAITDAANALKTHTANKPGQYQSQYGDELKEMIQGALNRPAFHYDYSQDPYYMDMTQKYDEQGREAMENALEDTEGLSAGYGNSYGDKVGAQTYQRWLQNRDASLFPKAQAQAYQEDAGDAAQDAANIGMLQSQDTREYGRHRDTVNDWRNDLNFLYTQLGDMSQQEYQRYLNDRDAWEKDRAYWYNRIYNEQQLALEWEKLNAQSRGGGGGRKPEPETEYIKEHGIDESNQITDVLRAAQEERRKKYEGKNAGKIAKGIYV
jgi:hypothetical protein